MGKYQRQYKSSLEERRSRSFSEAFKKKRVREIEEGRARVCEICKAYEVSATSVYRWIGKYSNQSKPERTIVESKSDTTKIIALERRIAELERMLGQKQIELEFKEKMIELAEKNFGIEIKKK